ncbi:hypothetical protein [Nocardioides iriomotensis]|uniref:Uncharacterized protein n=1 Tax=Nocardioides iriomotensis TaxID=715784 RepID=A0A4Q5J7V8_9ACTN|nr:hypothetical protein [Nocardioides iriomotensis]RYU14787.1 hypothetical protein ETU37_02020 [Nocardioides iriomotensis]
MTASAPAVVGDAVATIQAQDTEAVSVNEACSGDADEIAERTGYHVRFATVIYRGAPLSCAKPDGRGLSETPCSPRSGS